ncbi:transcription factor bHLH51 [Euphorbia lathyris]|uniref:transcription factor bHLH51 n=1 Tax=Euphorbia lathyris TaxID=212925 RepID=UPI003313D5CC
MEEQEQEEIQFYSSDNNYWQFPPRVNGFSPCNWSLPLQQLPSSWSFPLQDKDTASASNSHSQAEKRRRDRINAQLGILRKLVPDSDKMDKAALLGSVIEQVKELKGKATEVSKGITVPTEVDEVTVDLLNSDNNKNMFIRASVCCDDRPEVLSELIRAVKGLRLNIVRADIASVGGRVKTILILSLKDSNEVTPIALSLSAVKHSFNLALSRISSSSMPSNFRVRSKRQRFFLPSQ